MKDKNSTKLVARLSRAGKTCSGVATVVFSLLCSQAVFAEPEIDLAGQPVILDSQPLNVNETPVIQTEELTVVVQSQPDDSSTAPATLAMAEPINQSETGGVESRSTADVVSPLAVVEGEASQMSFALMLALLALIAVVPISRRH